MRLQTLRRVASYYDSASTKIIGSVTTMKMRGNISLARTMKIQDDDQFPEIVSCLQHEVDGRVIPSCQLHRCVQGSSSEEMTQPATVLGTWADIMRWAVTHPFIEFRSWLSVWHTHPYGCLVTEFGISCVKIMPDVVCISRNCWYSFAMDCLTTVNLSFVNEIPIVYTKSIEVFMAHGSNNGQVTECTYFNDPLIQVELFLKSVHSSKNSSTESLLPFLY